VTSRRGALDRAPDRARADAARPGGERFMRIGEVAEAAGVSADTLRHYERRGVLPPPARTAGGYRSYPPGTVARVATIRRALLIGFSLKELARVFQERERGRAPCREVRALVGERLDGVDQKIAELIALRDQLRDLLRDWDRTLAGTPQGRQARLLDRLR
jgi:DNA-binding transcriptional MerR regulator